SASTAGGPGGGVLQLKAANGASGAGLGGATLDGDLHGLFLQPHHQQQQLLVKREPEDLSHRKQQSSPGLAGGRSSSNGSSSSGSAKLVLANGGAGAEHGDGLDVIKDEYKAMAYSTQMFGGQPAPQGHHGSGTPSPGPYNDMQYAAAPPPGPQQPVYMSPVPNLRTSAPPPTSSSFATVPERYYSDYFPPVPDQGYATLRQQIPTYMDPAGEAAGGPTVSTSDLVRSYVRTSAYNHNKGVIAAATAAGLTVDLPSPDSGIGAEAITPRDQTAIQQ
ncbi:protein grainyhead-like, partial [Frankliniella occidentalis]|uniref:Protein grainyhead-like n=1 Tax=Frankliniella occidentalis TaxID=133901 RepID=A0A9C6XBA8_FRAOC